MKKYYHNKYSAKRKLRRLFAIIILFALTITAYRALNDVKPITYTEHVVTGGDTLWYIAIKESNGYGDIDTSVIVQHMMEKNGCGAIIHEGDIVLVPQY